jgi:hypothetical protein
MPDKNSVHCIMNFTKRQFINFSGKNGIFQVKRFTQFPYTYDSYEMSLHCIISIRSCKISF